MKIKEPAPACMPIQGADRKELQEIVKPVNTQRNVTSSNNFTTPENIPEQLRAHPYMGTRFAERPDGKINKPPYCVKPGRIRKADKTNSDNHGTFGEAVAALKAGKVDAIGVVLSEDDPITIV